MSEIERRGEGVTAADIIATVVDTMRVHGVPITSRARGMLGRQAKELLADGFAAETILIASVVALRRGEPQVAHFIAQDIVMVQAGQKLSRKESDAELANAAAMLNPRIQAERELLQRALGGTP